MMKNKKTNDIIEIFSGSVIEVEMIKSLLEDSEIVAYLQNENMGTIAPWQIAGGGAGAVSIIVKSEDYEKAKLVIERYEQNRDK